MRILKGLLAGLALSLCADIAAAHDNIRVIGTITDTRPGSVKVMTKEGAEAWIEVDTDSEITRDNAKVGIPELKKGLYVVVDGWGDDFYSLFAKKIRLVPPPK